MRTPIALIASTALLLPAAAVIATPAEAVTSASTATITKCSKTKYGVTVRIKLRDEGTFTRVRVSHPRGKGNFKHPRVKWTRQDAGQIGEGVTRDRQRGTASVRTTASGFADDGRQNSPSFRVPYNGPGTAIYVIFKLTNGKRITDACVQ